MMKRTIGTILCVTAVILTTGLADNPKPVQGEPAPVDVIEVSEHPAMEAVTWFYAVPLDEDLQKFIIDECTKRSIDPAIIIAIIGKESTFRANAVGDNGRSFGLMQIQKRWHVARMNKLGVTDLLDPYQNILVGIDYLDEKLDEGLGLEWALMAYNGGNKYANEKTAQNIVSSYASEIIIKYVELKERMVPGETLSTSK